MSGALDHGLWPWLVLIVFGFLPSEIWRLMSVFFARGLDERSEWVVWVRAVATALLAGVVAKLLLSPNGALAVIPLWARLSAMGLGMGAFFLTGRRTILVAIVVAEAVRVASGYWAR